MLPICPKCIVYHQPDGQLIVVHPIETGRLTVKVVAEETTVVELAPGQHVQHWAHKADGTYELREIVARGIGIMTVRTKPPEFRPETDDEFVARLFAETVPADAIDAGILLTGNIPNDRTFRGGWEKSGDLVGHNMAKCRDIQRDRIRAAREKLWPAADTAVTGALARGDAVAAAQAEARRQALRDAPDDPRIAAAATVDELKAVWPLPGGKI